MNAPAKGTDATTIPALRCRDATAKIGWLCKAFGFEKHTVYPDGRSGCNCRDPEGHVRWFGDCDPWVESAA